MISELGKELRKLRIDRNERLLDMADKLGRSSAFLSAVEVGRKSPPDDLVPKVIELYDLEEADAERLFTTSARSKDSFKLKAGSMMARDTASLLARRFDTLTDDELVSIQDILKKKESER